jgi:hypothetical protein
MYLMSARIVAAMLGIMAAFVMLGLGTYLLFAFWPRPGANFPFALILPIPIILFSAGVLGLRAARLSFSKPLTSVKLTSVKLFLTSAALVGFLLCLFVLLILESGGRVDVKTVLQGLSLGVPTAAFLTAAVLVRWSQGP